MTALLGAVPAMAVQWFFAWCALATLTMAFLGVHDMADPLASPEARRSKQRLRFYFYVLMSVACGTVAGAVMQQLRRYGA